MSGFACGAELVGCNDFVVVAGDGFEGAGFERDFVEDWACVGMELLGTEGFVVEEEFDFFCVGVDFDVFGVGGLIFGRPVQEERLAETSGWVDWSVGCGRGGLVTGNG